MAGRLAIATPRSTLTSLTTGLTSTSGWCDFGIRFGLGVWFQIDVQFGIGSWYDLGIWLEFDVRFSTSEYCSVFWSVLNDCTTQNDFAVAFPLDCNRSRAENGMSQKMKWYRSHGLLNDDVSISLTVNTVLFNIYIIVLGKSAGINKAEMKQKQNIHILSIYLLCIPSFLLSVELNNRLTILKNIPYWVHRHTKQSGIQCDLFLTQLCGN